MKKQIAYNNFVRILTLCLSLFPQLLSLLFHVLLRPASSFFDNFVTTFSEKKDIKMIWIKLKKNNEFKME